MLTRLARHRSGPLAVVLLVAFALLASMATEKREPPEPYEPPPPCRLVPSPVGAWSDASAFTPQPATRPGGAMPSPRITDPLLRRVFEDPGISLAAKGALAFVLTRPTGARVSEADLFTCSSDPLDAIGQAVRELARTGLVGTVKGERAGTGIALRGGDHQR